MKSRIIAVTGFALAVSAGAAAAQSGSVSPLTPSPTHPSVTPSPGNPAASSPVIVPPSPAGSGGNVVHLRNTVIQNNAALGRTLNPGFNTIDGMQRLSCTTTCTINVSAMVQVATTGRWAICAVVDGKNINPPCPFQGSLPQTGNYITGNSQQSWSVVRGTHTVQTQVFVSTASRLGNWQTTRQITNNLTISSPVQP